MTLEEILKKAISSAKNHVLENLSIAREKTGEENPFGDKTLRLDQEAEDLIIRTLQDSGISFSILTEERGAIAPESNAEFIAIIDPIDGSVNLERGVPLCSIGIAVVPMKDLMTTDDVEISIIDSIFTQETYIARKGSGVTRNGLSVSPSRTTDPSEAIISYDTNRSMVGEFGDASFRTLAKIKDTRRSASNLLDLCWTACGAIDAMIDLREILPIVHVSGTHMVQEAGGTVLDANGQRFVQSLNMDLRMNFIAAGTAELAHALSNIFRKVS
jgi:myo-inositol-1(or 4)-monophosphatase